jgi:hypothetical protein
MARIRTIKPEFFTSEDIVELTPLARLLYIACWCEADKEGRLIWRPRTMKLRYFPADVCDIDAVADELVKAGLIVPYGDTLAHIPSFKKHQHLNPRESPSKLPAPEDAEPVRSKVTRSLREEVMARDDHECRRCGSVEDLTLDHILPQSSGGTHVADNLRVLCRACNSARPISGPALTEDLLRDGYTIDGLRKRLTGHAS